MKMELFLQLYNKANSSPYNFQCPQPISKSNLVLDNGAKQSPKSKIFNGQIKTNLKLKRQVTLPLHFASTYVMIVT
jgi:hypothetical protein